jgi:hypothetical protein
MSHFQMLEIHQQSKRTCSVSNIKRLCNMTQKIPVKVQLDPAELNSYGVSAVYKLIRISQKSYKTHNFVYVLEVPIKMNSTKSK